MNIIESLKWRYACKKFNDSKIISEDKIEIIKKAFNLTATSFGLQPIKMIVVKNKELQKELANNSYGQQQVANASHLLVLCIDKDITPQDIDASFNREITERGTSEETLAGFRKQLQEMFAAKTLEQKQQSAIYQTYIVLGNLMTICATEGIDACPMEGFLPNKISETLNLKDRNLIPTLLLPIGYRADDDIMSTLKKVRKPLGDVIIEMY